MSVYRCYDWSLIAAAGSLSVLAVLASVHWLICQIEVRATSILHRPRTAAAAETRSGRGRRARLHP